MENRNKRRSQQKPRPSSNGGVRPGFAPVSFQVMPSPRPPCIGNQCQANVRPVCVGNQCQVNARPACTGNQCPVYQAPRSSN